MTAAAPSPLLQSIHAEAIALLYGLAPSVEEAATVREATEYVLDHADASPHLVAWASGLDQGLATALANQADYTPKAVRTPAVATVVWDGTEYRLHRAGKGRYHVSNETVARFAAEREAARATRSIFDDEADERLGIFDETRAALADVDDRLLGVEENLAAKMAMDRQPPANA